MNGRPSAAKLGQHIPWIGGAHNVWFELALGAKWGREMLSSRNLLVAAGFVLASLPSFVPPAAGQETALYAFKGGNDGEYPNGGLISDGHLLYGTTFGELGNGTTPADKHCGRSCGGMFDLDPLNPLNSFQPTYAFTGSGKNGAFPTGEVLLQGRYTWGTTEYGAHNACGGLGCGTVYRFNSSTGKIKTFLLCQQPDCADGAFPHAGLISEKANGGGTLYGTTSAGGSGNGFLCASIWGGCGVVYQIARGERPEPIYSFCQMPSCADGAVPLDRLLKLGGDLYGTTAFGGNAASAGTIFRLDPASGQEQVLYKFCSDFENNICADGAVPQVGLTADSVGNLYGATTYGGADACPGWPGCGVVFELSFPYGPGDYKVLSVFHGADSTATDPQRGSFPLSQPTIDASGNLYGTTSRGGSGACQAHDTYGCGVVFTIPSGGSMQVLYDFQGSVDGSLPVGALVLQGGNLFGITREKGGTAKTDCNCGVVYQLPVPNARRQ